MQWIFIAVGIVVLFLVATFFTKLILELRLFHFFGMDVIHIPEDKKKFEELVATQVYNTIHTLARRGVWLLSQADARDSETAPLRDYFNEFARGTMMQDGGILVPLEAIGKKLTIPTTIDPAFRKKWEAFYREWRQLGRMLILVSILIKVSSQRLG